MTEIVFSYEVLESLREHFEQEGMQDEADVMNEAHYLVQHFHENGHFTEITIN
jgi:predicted chitinase